MTLPKTKNDLISCYIDYPGKPKDIRHSFNFDPQEGLVLKTYRIPNIEEFSKLATLCVNRFVKVPTFFEYMKDIVETAVKLRLFAQYITFNIEEQQSIPQNIQQKIQNMPFRVMIPDAMKKKEYLRYKKMKFKSDKSPDHFINYSMNKIELLFDVDEKASDFMAIIKNYPIVVKASLNTNKKMKNVLSQDAYVFSDFIDTLVNINEYCDQNQGLYTQKSWDDFLRQSLHDSALSYVQENVVNPSIMHLVDCSRRFLSEALMAEHALEIAETKTSASFRLKEDKQQIYRLAEKYGYIDKAKPFLFCENLRNQVAHPEKRTPNIIQNALKISHLYTQFVFRFLDKDFVCDYYDKFPVSFPLDELNMQYQAYQKVRQAQILSDELTYLLPDDLKHIQCRKKILFLSRQRIITPKESEEIEQLFLNRNAVAHGQMKNGQVYSQLISDISVIRHAFVHRQHG